MLDRVVFGDLVKFMLMWIGLRLCKVPLSFNVLEDLGFLDRKEGERL